MRVKFNSLFENILLKEGTKYDKKASKLLVDADLFDQEDSDNIINDLFRNKIHAFVHSPSWLEKYLVGIARMIVEESGGDSNQADMFLDECSEVFDKYLTYVKEIRDKQADPIKFDREFMDKMSYQDVEDFVDNYQKELDKQSKDELSKMNFTSSNYELVPIDSFEEFNSKFGGRLTGDGSSDSYAGGGGTAWCHTNNESTYNDWINRYGGKNKFFVLMNKNFKDIPFNPKTNIEMQGKDEYGNSLIAILVDKYGNLVNATLRCNHERRIPNPDNQYKTYAELSKVVGFNVEEKINELMDFEESPIKNGVYYYDGEHIPDDLRDIVKKVVVKDDITRINEYAFYYCMSLESITISDSVTEIGGYAFSGCTSLKSIIIPNSVTYIGEGAFRRCASLKSIIIPNSVTEIGESIFSCCNNLESITIPKSVTKIGGFAFDDCRLLKSIIIPDSVTEIGMYAFYNCISLKLITIPDNVIKIGNDVFYNCTHLTVKCSKNSYAYNYCIDYDIKVSTY